MAHSRRLVPELGPFSDQILTFAVFLILPRVAAPLLIRMFHKTESSPKRESGTQTHPEVRSADHLISSPEQSSAVAQGRSES
jgi:hypothetical protein